MTVRVLGTLHSGFTVADVRRTAGFFRDCLGFAVTDPRTAPTAALSQIVGIEGAVAEIIFVSAPGHTIELLQYRSPGSATTTAPRPCDIGFAHLSLLVDDVRTAAQAAAAYGFMATPAMPLLSTGPFAGRHVTYLRDAHGFTLEIMSESAAH